MTNLGCSANLAQGDEKEEGTRSATSNNNSPVGVELALSADTMADFISTDFGN